jgi:serine phosphatase RsbU (regulator of sigma subunit)
MPRRHRVRQRVAARRRAFAYQRHLIAEQRAVQRVLRQAILPTPDQSSEINGARVAVRYLAADPATALGGDWHVTLALPGGEVLLAVGDVIGHGPDAVGPMVQLRHATTAFALVGDGPAAILDRLNALLCRQDHFSMASAVVGRYRAGDHTLTWACAGHPPILLANRDRVAPPQRQVSGMMLGVSREASYEQVTTPLARTDMVLMYTDGLVEERGHSIDDGLRAFAEEVRRSLGNPTRDRLATVMSGIRPNPDDDVCVVGVEAAYPAPLGGPRG